MDPDDVVRLGVRTALARDARLQICGDTGCGQAALDLSRARAPNVVLLEADLPRLDGIRLCKALAGGDQAPAFLFYSARFDERTVVEALTAGAAGYLPKGCSSPTLVAAIHDLASGGSRIDPRATSWLLTQFRHLVADTAETEVQSLTERERRMVVMIADGHTNAEIGRALGLAEKTIRNQMSRLLQRLGFERREQVAAWVGRHRQTFTITTRARLAESNGHAVGFTQPQPALKAS